MAARKILLLIFCALLSALLSSPGSTAASTSRPQELRLLTGSAGGQWDTLGRAIAEVVTDSVLPCTSRLGGAISNLKRISNGNAELGFSMACFLHAPTADASIPESDKPLLLAELYPQIFYIFIRTEFAERHGITYLASLVAKRIPLNFATLKSGTGSEFLLSRLLQTGFQTSLEQLRRQGWRIHFNNYAEIADHFVNGELDGFAYTAGPDAPLIARMERYIDFTILPISLPVLQRMQSQLGTGVYTIPKGTWHSVIKPVTTLRDSTCLVAHKELPASLVTAIIHAIWQRREYLATETGHFLPLSPQTALPASLKAHEGAIRFWTEQRR